MNKNFLITMSLLAAWMVCIQGCSQADNQVCFKDACVGVELAISDEEVTRGLSHRESLPEDAGMLFVFSRPSRTSFWMKDTLIPLDIIWVDYAKRVVHIEVNLPPCPGDPCPNYTPADPAMYVLEVNAHYAKKWGIKLGDQLEFRLKRFIVD